MRIIIDTREKLPFQFGDIATVRAKLEVGDYSIEGFEDSVAIERKSLDDFVGSTIHDFKRFRKNLEVLTHYQHKAIVVESSLQDVFQHRYRSKTHSNAVFGSIVGISAKWRIPVFFWENHAYAQMLVRKYLMSISDEFKK